MTFLDMLKIINDTKERE